jgi:hypothetical protein
VSAPDPLAELAARLDAAQAAAERLAARAAQAPQGDGQRDAAEELRALVEAAGALVPEELRPRLAELARALLLALRALVDAGLDALDADRDGSAARGPAVEDVPVE